MDWAEGEEEGSPRESFDRFGFGTRFGDGCLGISSSPFSHLERFLEGVDEPALGGSIGISERWTAGCWNTEVVKDNGSRDHTRMDWS